MHVRISSEYPARLRDLRVESRLAFPDTRVRVLDRPIGPGQDVDGVAPLDVPLGAPPTRPWFHRSSIASNHYLVRDSTDLHLGASRPVAWVATPISVEGRLVHIETPVRVVEPKPPFGSRYPLLAVVPPVSVQPAHRALILPSTRRSVTVSVEVTSNAPVELGRLALGVPANWSVTPTQHPLSFARRGERGTFEFQVAAPEAPQGAMTLEAVKGLFAG